MTMITILIITAYPAAFLILAGGLLFRVHTVTHAQKVRIRSIAEPETVVESEVAE